MIPRRFAAWLGRDDDLGRRGERLAARWLHRRGYRVLGRNVFAGRDEADVIALAPDGRTIVIVEVKTRAAADPPPEVGLGARKRAAMIRLSHRVRAARGDADAPVRLDAIAIVWAPSRRPVVRHHVGVFGG